MASQDQQGAVWASLLNSMRSIADSHRHIIEQLDLYIMNTKERSLSDEEIRRTKQTIQKLRDYADQIERVERCIKEFDQAE